MAKKEKNRLLERSSLRPLEELTKGSMEYTVHRIRISFHRTFPRNYQDWFWVEEIFATYLIVNHEDLPVDEFYLVEYSQTGPGEYTFAPRETWETVEVSYRPVSSDEGEPQTISSSRPPIDKKTSIRFVERIGSSLELVESDDDSPPDGPWSIRGLGITADVVNANRRRYASYVLEDAVHDLQSRLGDSNGQGRLVLAGEADHPTDKGNVVPLLQETIINWNDIKFDGAQTLLEGNLLGTRLGRDTRAQMKGGVKPDISQRGYGRSIMVEEGGEEFEDVTDLIITGYDLVANGADPNAGVTYFERRHDVDPAAPIKPVQEVTTVDELTLAELKEKYPDLVAQIVAESNTERRAVLEAELQSRADQDRRLAEAVASNETTFRQALNLGPNDDIIAALEAQQSQSATLQTANEENEAALAAYRETEQRAIIDTHIDQAVAGLNFPQKVATVLITTVKGAVPNSVEAADTLIASKREEYNTLLSTSDLAARGLKQNGSTNGSVVTVVGPVVESELGIPAFAVPSRIFTERLVERGCGELRDFNKPVTKNERFTALVLEAFDTSFRTQLIRETEAYQAFQEAEATTDLNLPYSVSRTIIEQVYPALVALSIFDFATIDTSPTRIYYEAYSGESGASPAITDESIASDEDAWVDLAHKRIRQATVVVTSDPAGTTYTEWTDYVVDYGEGRIWTLSTGTIGDATALLVDYTYDAVREGEGSAIQRGKATLSYQTVEAAADRLATLINDEAITFARTQLGWDAVTRTLNMLIREIREMIDSHMIMLALASAVRAANSGGTYTAASDTLDDLVKVLGVAKVAVLQDNYTPTFFLLSLANAEVLSNWDGFKRDGFPDAILNSAGFVGQVKGLPVYQSAQMIDARGLVGHPELVQHRVLSTKPMSLRGPYQGRSGANLIAAEEYFIEEYNTTHSLIPEKGGFIIFA